MLYDAMWPMISKLILGGNYDYPVLLDFHTLKARQFPSLSNSAGETTFTIYSMDVIVVYMVLSKL